MFVTLSFDSKNANHLAKQTDLIEFELFHQSCWVLVLYAMPVGSLSEVAITLMIESMKLCKERSGGDNELF